MAVGWAKDGAVQEEIDAGVADAVNRARSRLGKGVSRTHCEMCEDPIPEARRNALPGVRLCIGCQSELEKTESGGSLYNRRGSKDSQLK